VPTDGNGARCGLRLGVGGHDRLGGVVPVVRLQVRHRGRQAGDDLLQRQLFQDHTGRKRQHLARLDIQQLGQLGAGGLRIGQTLFARARIGVARIDHQRADRRAAMLHGGQIGLADLDRRSAEAIEREHAGDSGAFGHAHDEDVLAVGLLDAGFGETDLDAVDGFQVGCDWQGGIDGHGDLVGKIANLLL
jgi:hypothetical protein